MAGVVKRHLCILNTQLLLVSVLVFPLARAAEGPQVYQYDFREQPHLRQQQYNSEAGFGTDNFPNSGENAFSVEVPEGDYAVQITVSGLRDSSRFLVFSEDRRVMSDVLDIQRGETKELDFLASVRRPQLEQAEQDPTEGPRVGLRGDEDISRNWDEKLTIALSNHQVQFDHIRIESINSPSNLTSNKPRSKIASKPKILLAGDSTVADQASGDYASWGQFVPALLRNQLVVNHARSGETLKSYIFSRRWGKLLSQTRAGDIVLIQFAHNDEKKQWPSTYSAADGAFPEYLRAFIADVRQKGAMPVLVTPVARRIYSEQGELVNTHEGYDKAVREVGKVTGVPVIDLTEQTTAFYRYLGRDKARRAFAANGGDRTHHNHYGAWVIANMVVNSLQVIYPELVQPENAGFDPAHPIRPGERVITPGLWPDMRPGVVEISGS